MIEQRRFDAEKLIGLEGTVDCLELGLSVGITDAVTKHVNRIKLDKRTWHDGNNIILDYRRTE